MWSNSDTPVAYRAVVPVLVELRHLLLVAACHHRDACCTWPAHSSRIACMVSKLCTGRVPGWCRRESTSLCGPNGRRAGTQGGGERVVTGTMVQLTARATSTVHTSSGTAVLLGCTWQQQQNLCQSVLLSSLPESSNTPRTPEHSPHTAQYVATCQILPP